LKKLSKIEKTSKNGKFRKFKNIRINLKFQKQPKNKLENEKLKIKLKN